MNRACCSNCLDRLAEKRGHAVSISVSIMAWLRALAGAALANWRAGWTIAASRKPPFDRSRGVSMLALVTGAAGFIGSHLCEALLHAGHDVIGLDAFIPYYDRRIKEANVAAAKANPKFRFTELDLRTDKLDEAVQDVDVLFHLAAMPGLVWSWSHFDWYDSCNVLGTQRLLEAIRQRRQPLGRLVYASTSSIYGLRATESETATPQPISPYGVTKLGGEHLCAAYREAYGVPTVALRYFSVYGPRQRPDMGYHKFIERCLKGETIVVNGDGKQARGNTYVSDCVQATLLAADAQPGTVFNVGGGEVASVWDVLRLIEELTGKKIQTRTEPPRPGDQAFTRADTARIEKELGWQPRVSLRDGLAQQVNWQRQQLAN
jgi:nucleoside-diphosphate-sugar epimerase